MGPHCSSSMTIDEPLNEIEAARPIVIASRPARVFVGVKVAPTIAAELALLARDLELFPMSSSNATPIQSLSSVIACKMGLAKETPETGLIFLGLTLKRQSPPFPEPYSNLSSCGDPILDRSDDENVRK